MKKFVNCDGLSLADSAEAYARHGLKVFPVIENQKNSAIAGWHLNASDNPNVINGLWTNFPENNIGVPTGAINGFFVVDIDMKNGKDGQKSLRELEARHGKLPVTLEAITPTGGRHLFFKNPEVELRNRADVFEGIDVRAEGGYVLVEPSVVNYLCYKFIDVDREIADAPGWLIKVLSEDAPKANKGDKPITSRNVYIFNEALKLNSKGVELEEAIETCIGLYKANCREPHDEDEITRTVKSAYRYEKQEIVPELFELNEKHAVIDVGGKARVLKEKINEMGQCDFDLSTFEDFRALYSNRYVTVEGKTKTLGAYWLSHPIRRQYEGLGFYPKGAPDKIYNLWRGFAVEPKEGDCSLFLELVMDVIASGDKAIYDYIIGWCAHMIQHPDKLIGTAIVLRGLQGIGKGTFANGIGSLLGQHYMLVNSSNLLVGRFNGHLKGKVLLLADEALWGGDKQAEGTLKSMVTEPFITIEEKGVNAYTIKNHLHMIFSTNNEWAVPAGAQERRFFVVDVSDKRMQDRVYFGKIEEQMNNGGREALLYYLMNYDLKSVNLDTFPKTKALLETKIMSMTAVQKFLYYVLQQGNLHAYGNGNGNSWNDGLIVKKDLHDHFIDFCKRMNQKHIPSQQEFGTQLMKMFKEGTVNGKAKKQLSVHDESKRQNCYKFPSLEDCRKHFERYFQQEFPWDEQ